MTHIKRIVEAAKKNRLFLAAAGAFVLIAATVTAHWWRTHPGISAPGLISAAASVFLFSVVCVLFLRHWISDWQAIGNTGEERKAREKIGAVLLVRVFISLLALDTAAYQTENAINAYRNQDLKLMFGLWLPNLLCSFAALAVMAASVQKLRASYGAYFIVYYAVAIGATWLLSAPRYLLVLFPVSFGMAELTRDRRLDALLTILTTITGVLYVLLFTARWQVW